MEEKQVLVRIEDLCKYFRLSSKEELKAVDHVSFDIFRNETVGIVGESGCGKTTLGRTVLGLYPATSGRVLFDGMEDVYKRQPEKRIRQYPHELSGGMRQRVMIAMALACEPKILIADEPTTALDVTTQADIMELIRELQEKMGTSVILVTHDLGIAAEVGDRIQVMYAGEIIETGTKSEICLLYTSRCV